MKDFPLIVMTDITVNLPTANKLRDAGWEQKESTFWRLGEKDREVFTYQELRDKNISLDAVCAAPTAEEVLRELPPETEEKGVVRFPRVSAVEQWEEGEYDTLANAAAEMWIYLRTNDLL